MREGTKVRIKTLAWLRFCDQTKTYRPNPGIRTVTKLSSIPPLEDRVLLDVPVYWWKHSDLQIVGD